MPRTNDLPLSVLVGSRHHKHTIPKRTSFFSPYRGTARDWAMQAKLCLDNKASYLREGSTKPCLTYRRRQNKQDCPAVQVFRFRTLPAMMVMMMVMMIKRGTLPKGWLHPPSPKPDLCSVCAHPFLINQANCQIGAPQHSKEKNISYLCIYIYILYIIYIYTFKLITFCLRIYIYTFKLITFCLRIYIYIYVQFLLFIYIWVFP